MNPSPAIHRLAAGLLCSSLFLAASASSHAQNVFVCLAGKTNLTSIVSIPSPGHGWNYAAAAPVAGSQWNRIRRTSGVDVTDPAQGDAKHAGRIGIHDIDTGDGVPLVDPQGNATDVKLSIRMEIATLAADKPRLEPAAYNRRGDATPAGLMDAVWRVYLPDNRLRFSLSGLVPGRRYQLYCYGACADPTRNPSGEGEGARFDLDPRHVPAGASGTAQTAGGYYGSIYTFSPETNQIALSPMGTTWTRLDAIADDTGSVSFSTGQNSYKRQFVNGFQLVEATQ